MRDGLGSTIAFTNSSGAVTAEYNYEPFGATASGDASYTAFLYTGRELDNTDFYYYRARYYDARRQRFLSEDPVRFFGGDINLYAYVSNNPTMYSDPLGLWTVGAGIQVNNYSAGQSVTGSAVVVIDGYGQIGIAFTGGYGAVAAFGTTQGGASIIGLGQASTASTIQQLGGGGFDVSGTISAPGVPTMFGGWFGGRGYQGVLAGAGWGTGDPLTVSGEVTATGVVCLFNCLPQGSGKSGTPANVAP